MSTLSSYSNKQAIREVLGCFLQSPSLMREYKCMKSDFPELFHKLIFAAINNLYKNGVENIDAIAIDDYLSNYETSYKTFEKNNGIDFVMNITELANPVNIKYYYEQLKKFSLLRRYIENGIDVSEFFNPEESDPVTLETQRENLDNSTIMDIINHYKRKMLEVTAPFILSEGRDSKKAGVGGKEQKEMWKHDTAWGIGYSSAFLTTIAHGLRKRRFGLRSASTGVGKTRTSLSDLCASCAPKYYDKILGKWIKNPNGTNNGGLYIGTEMELIEEINPVIWAWMADVPQEHIEFNMYKEGEEERVDEAIRILEEEAHIYLEYVPQYDSTMLHDIIEEHVLKNNISYIWFDYIHTTVELISEFAIQSKVKMNTREDQVLANLSNKIKGLTREFNVSIDAGTQVTIANKNKTESLDETIIRGSKAIADKADLCMILMPPSQKEMKQIETIIRNMMGLPLPNAVYSIYKNRGGKRNRVKIWLYIDYNTMRMTDLFVTDYQYNLITDIKKTYINIFNEDQISDKPSIIEVKD